MKKIGSKGKSSIVWILMGMLVLGLGGFGVDNFTGGSSEIGKVGDVTIDSEDYARGLRAEMQGFAQQAGRPLTAAEAQSVGLPQNVLSRMVLGATLEEEANRLGISVGDKIVADQIVNAASFKGMNGQFDPQAYEATLRNEGLTKRKFEHDLRMDEARMIIQRAVVAGGLAPQATVNRSVDWIVQTRNVRWTEITTADLAAPVATPDEATLIAWHKANADRFTAPEQRKITYAWLTPEMLEETVQVDDQALRDVYQSRIDEFQKPDRRMVERLVFQSEDAAKEAKARLDKGEANFEQLAQERGLSLTDIDLGEVTEASLGEAGAAVFALEQPGVVGPLPSSLGPALYSMNAILEPVNIPFEEAKPDLRGEAALDRARRQIDDLKSKAGDLIAGGATPEDLVKETDMKLGQIEWTKDDQPEEGSIAGYPAFRTVATDIQTTDFPELHDLDDGGVFVARLDEIVPPALIPFDEVKDRVLADWTATETHRQLLAVADERKMSTDTDVVTQPATNAPRLNSPASNQTPNPAPVPGAASTQPAASEQAETPAPSTWHEVADLARDGFIEGTPQALVAGAFKLDKPGATDVVDADNRVFLVTLDQINPIDQSSDRAAQVRSGVEQRLGDMVKSDLFEYYARAVQSKIGITINQAAIDAANSRM